MRIEVWSDVVCPFCYVGKRELQAALADFEHADEVEVVWKAFELDRTASAEGEDTAEHLMAKYGLSADEVAAQNDSIAERAAQVGLEFNWRSSKSTNTLDAHRLIKLAETEGKGDEATEAFMKAFFTDGELVSDHDTLVRVATGIGLDEARVREVLGGVEFAEQVHADESEAAGYGISGVPFFLFEGQWAVSGAQPAELFTQALDQVWAETHKPKFITLEGVDMGNQPAGGGSCGCGGCGCGAN